MKTFLLLSCLCVVLTAAHVGAQSKSLILLDDTTAINPQTVKQLPDGSAVVEGVSAYDTLGNTNCYIARISAAGSVLWAKRFATQMPGACSMATSADALYMQTEKMDNTGTIYYYGFMKFDFNGALLLDRRFATYSVPEGPNNMTLLPNGNIAAMLGQELSTVVVCLDQNLNYQWSKSIKVDTTGNKNFAVSMTLTSNGDIVVSGYHEGDLFGDITVAVLSQTGQVLSARWDNNVTEHIWPSQIVSIGTDIYTAGTLEDYTTSGYYGACLYRTDGLGNIVWSKQFHDLHSGNYDFSINRLDASANGHLFFMGTDNYYGTVAGEMDTSGNLLWTSIAINTSSLDVTCSSLDAPTSHLSLVQPTLVYPYALINSQLTLTSVDALHNASACSYQHSDVAASPLAFDYTLADIPASNITEFNWTTAVPNTSLLDVTTSVHTIEICSTSKVNELPVPTFTLAPNPTSDELQITVPDMHNRYTLSIVNALGQIVVEQPISQLQTSFSAALLPGGVYMALLNDGALWTKKEFVVQH